MIYIENINSYINNINKKILYAYKEAFVKASKLKPGEKIITISNGNEETINTSSVDSNGNPDWLLTKLNSDKTIALDNKGNKNIWIVKHDIFVSKYEYVENDIFKAKPIINKFIQLDEDISFIAPWGEKQNIYKNGYLNITDLSNIYGISEIDFNDTYKVKEGN